MAKQFTVHFKDVGRDKKTWDEDMDRVDEDTMTAAVHRKRAIASAFPAFTFNPDGSGVIICGFHTCGTYTVQVNGELKVTP